MKKPCLSLLMILILSCVLSACAGTVSKEGSVPEEKELQGMDSKDPYSSVDKLEAHTASFESSSLPAALTAEFVLPDGFTLSDKPDEAGFPFLGRNLLFDIKYIYDGSGVCVGAIGANICTEESIGDPALFDDPQAVYSGINIGSGFCVDTHEVYESVETDTCRNAISSTRYSAVYLNGVGYSSDKEVCNPAILSENPETHCYIVIEITNGAASPEVIEAMAKAAAVR